MNSLKFLVDEFERALLSLDRDGVKNIIAQAVKIGEPIQVTGELICESLQRIGKAWEEGKVALSQVYISGIICEESLNEISS